MPSSPHQLISSCASCLATMLPNTDGTLSLTPCQQHSSLIPAAAPPTAPMPAASSQAATIPPASQPPPPSGTATAPTVRLPPPSFGRFTLPGKAMSLYADVMSYRERNAVTTAKALQLMPNTSKRKFYDFKPIAELSLIDPGRVRSLITTPGTRWTIKTLSLRCRDILAAPDMRSTIAAAKAAGTIM